MKIDGVFRVSLKGTWKLYSCVVFVRKLLAILDMPSLCFLSRFVLEVTWRFFKHVLRETNKNGLEIEAVFF